jgi:putative hydrolase of the HAD superfamily
MKGELSADAYWKLAGKRLGLDQEESLAMRKDFSNAYTLDEKVLELVEVLSKNGIAVGLLSNTMDDTEQALEDRGFKKALAYFDTVVLSHQVGMTKPNPEIYCLACDKLGMKPRHVVHIDDLKINIEGAREAGLMGWLYRRDQFNEFKRFLLENRQIACS